MKTADRIMNAVVYGNPEGHPNFKGDSSKKYDSFFKSMNEHLEEKYEEHDCKADTPEGHCDHPSHEQD